MWMWTGFKRLSSHYWTLVTTVMTLQVPQREGNTRKVSQDEFCLRCPFLSFNSTRNFQFSIEAVFRIKETQHSYEQIIVMCALLNPPSKPGNPKTFRSVRSILTSSCGFQATGYWPGYISYFIYSSRTMQLSSPSNRTEY